LDIVSPLSTARRRAPAALFVALSIAVVATSAHAQGGGTTAQTQGGVTAAQIRRIRAALAAQAKQLEDQNRRIAEQAQIIQAQGQELAALRAQASRQTAAIASPPPSPGAAAAQRLAQGAAPVVGGPAGAQPPGGSNNAAEQPLQSILPSRPVGEAPAETATTEKQVVQTALPQGIGVLTRAHHFIFEPDLEYDRIANNLLVFQGVEIVPGVQLGLVNASTTAQDVAVATADLRYGVTDRFEVEVRVPYLYRHDLATTLAQQVANGVPPVNMTSILRGYDIGDIEFDARYQLNRGQPGEPVFVANLRFKTATGVGPFDVPFDSSGIAESLATGSGFYVIEPSITMLLPSDPVVFFGNLGYLYGIPADVNKTIGTTLVGNVNPGDAFDASMGFAFALNPRFSVSFGFTDQYYYGIRENLGTTIQKSNNLEVGALTMGWSYRLTKKLTLITNFEFGVTPDAPNLRLIFRLPFTF
jgi:hypothetical protein